MDEWIKYNERCVVRECIILLIKSTVIMSLGLCCFYTSIKFWKLHGLIFAEVTASNKK